MAHTAVYRWRVAREPDGTEVHNPGVKMSWEGEHGFGFPVVSKDDPSIFEDLLKRAAT